MKRSSVLEIVIDDKRWNQIPALRKRLMQALHATEKQLPRKLRFPFMVTVLLTTDTKIHRLNREFRGKDKPTNVLSFPQFSLQELAKITREKGHIPIGDIAIAYQYLVAEAKKSRKLLINHLTHLLIHGLLHLLGYDHISDAKANKMERMERRIMAGLNLPDPYAKAVVLKKR